MKRFNVKKCVLAATLAFTMLMTGCGGGAATGDTSATEPASSEVVTEAAADGEVSATTQKIIDSGVLRVGSSGDLYAYIDQSTGEFVGPDADIIIEAAKRLGIPKVEMSNIPFSELIVNLNSDNIDIICDGMYVREDRAQQIYYGDIWYTQGGALLVPEGSTINGQSDFDPASTVVGYTPGTVWQTAVEQWAADGLIKEARSTGDQGESIVALQNGKIDAFLTDSPVVENLFAFNPDALAGLKLCDGYTDDEGTIGRIAPSVAFGHEDFMDDLNRVVAEMRDEGVLDEIFEKYGLDPALHSITNDEKDNGLS
jgi:polar amino acid transport system substrate-binding protein